MRNIIIFLIAIFMSCTASAYVMGGSNLGFTGYPEFSDMEPNLPFGDDQFAMENYRREVANYVDKAKQYVDNSNSDIQRIKEAQQEAIDKANRVVEEYNRKVRGY